MTKNNTSISYKGITDGNTTTITNSTSAKAKNPLKKLHCISERRFVVIDESLVKSLGIDEENTWFEQEQTENGILLRIRRFHFTEKKDEAARK
jgi:hypothetical protein